LPKHRSDQLANFLASLWHLKHLLTQLLFVLSILFSFAINKNIFLVMKHLLGLLALCVLLFAAPAPAAIAQGSLFKIGTATDTARQLTTKTQTATIGSKKGITVQYWFKQLTDTCTGYASIWGSIDGVTYAQWPSADSVAIAAATDTKKLWFLATDANKNPIQYIQVRTRLATNTTTATAKGKVTTHGWTY